MTMKKNMFTFLRLLLFAAVAVIAVGVGCDTAVTPVVHPMPTTLRGVNLVGAEWQWTATSTPVEGQNYKWVSHQDIDYLTARGFTFGRLLFSWEILQPTLNGAFATAYFNTLVDRVNYATSKGMWIMIEPHGGSTPNFARYKGNQVGTAAVPNSAFADLWVRLANQFKANPRVVFGLMNEPNNISTMQWFNAAQAAVVGIRSTTASNVIMIAGNGWSQPSSWNDTWYDTATTKVSNANAWSVINDPLKRTVVSVHTYLDAAGGGGASDIANPDIMSQRLQPVVTWARSRGLKVHLTEFGADSNTAGSQVAVENGLKYIDANRDVFLGWSWWAYGPCDWWGSYRFTLCPQNGTENVKISWLKPYLASPESPVTDAGSDAAQSPTSPSKPTSPIAFTKGAKMTVSVNGVTNWIFVPNSYDSTHNTPMKLLVWLHGCGGQSEWDVNMVSDIPNQNWISLAVGGREKSCWSNYTTDGTKVLGAIAQMKTHFNIDPRQVYYGGYSSGGDIGYELVFKNASLFAGAIFENTGPSTAAMTASATASWKVNIAQLSHTGDTTYPIATIRTKMATLKSAGFPVTLIEKPGTHYDPDNGTSGTQYDLRTFLLPYVRDAGWTAPGPQVDAGAHPPPAACVYTYSAWGECKPDNSQSRVVTGTSPNPCTAGPVVLSQSCVYVPPTCVYTYSPYGPCEPDGTQKRTVTATSPTPCTPTTQSLISPCTYIWPDTDGDGIADNLDKCPTVKGIKTNDGTSNGCAQLLVTAVKTYDWGTGYCKQFYFKNPNPVPMSWKTMTIYLKDGKLRGPGSVWGGTFQNPSAVGTIVVYPKQNERIEPGQNPQVVGFCADFGASKYVGTNGGLTY